MKEREGCGGGRGTGERGKEIKREKGEKWTRKRESKENPEGNPDVGTARKGSGVGI